MVDALEVFRTDYDWRAAFNEATGHGYGGSWPDQEDEAQRLPQLIDAVREVIAASEGERDERDWLAIVRLVGGEYAVVSAGCDFTGWDCQAGGVVERYATIAEACSRLALTPRERERLADQLRARTDVVLDWPDVDEVVEEYNGQMGRRDKRA